VLKELELLPVYDSEYYDLIRDLQVPLLSHAKDYLRGVGFFTSGWLRLAGQGGRVTGLDFSEGMLEKARQKGAGLDLSFLHHDLTKPIPLPDRSFDLVLSCLAMEHLPSLDLPFSEMARICRPGVGWS